MLTKEERLELELECVNAKARCREAWEVLVACEKIVKTYFKIHDHWRAKFEKADRKLAMEDRLRKVGTKEKKQSAEDSVKKTLQSLRNEPNSRELIQELIREIEEE